MKVVCQRAELSAALQVVSGVIPTRPVIEILKNAKLQVTNEIGCLLATDQKIRIRHTLSSIEIETPGEILIPTGRMLSILREVPDDNIRIELVDGNVFVASGHSEFVLTTEDPAEFPEIPEYNDEHEMIIPGNTLQEMIQKTSFAAATESHRYALEGILLTQGEETLTMVATDVRRLAMIEIPIPGKVPEKPANEEPVIPTKALGLIDRSIEGEEEVHISIQENSVQIKTERTTVTSQLVGGRYPRYRDVIPTSSKLSVKLLAGAFHSAVRQAQIVVDPETRGVDFILTSGLLTLQARASTIGESKVELPVQYEGEKFKVTFEPRYIADFLKVLEPETEVELRLTDAESAALFLAGGNYTYIAMPLSS